MITEQNTEMSNGSSQTLGAISIVGEPISYEVFRTISGQMAGYPFVKVVVERATDKIHFINDHKYKFHALYIGENLLGLQKEEIFRDIDKYNQGFYLDPERKYFLGILAFHGGTDKSFFSLETVEIDNIDPQMIQSFYKTVRDHVDQKYPILFKPANHLQEKIVGSLERDQLPRIFNYELFASSPFVALNEGKAHGRVRVIQSVEEYKEVVNTIEWYDIIVMEKVPEDIPRVAGIINALHTTPLSHTNVLACGWHIPNSIQLGIMDQIKSRSLDNEWVIYSVSMNATEVWLEKTDPPQEVLQKPTWKIQQIKLEEPDIIQTSICNLDDLRMADRFRYGTKAANLGELRHVLLQGSDRLAGFYKIKRPPRENLLNYLQDFLQTETKDLKVLTKSAWRFLKDSVEIPRGIAIPFSLQQEFLSASPQIQQQIGKLKMALELGARQVDSLCLTLQRMIRSTRMPTEMRDFIDNAIVDHLGGVSSFVVRSSSNAEDLEHFSAAGIYESINHVTTAENIFDSIKEVWASLVSPRSVRLRHDVGISLDDCYMGVIIQEEVDTCMGGVMVTMNPANPKDFRDVFLNVSCESVNNVVQGSDLPYQYLFNTVEGGGRTISIGNAQEDLSESDKSQLQKLAFAGRLLQSHFSQDYTFSAPQDIEWALSEGQIYILQLRPYAK